MGLDGVVAIKSPPVDTSQCIAPKQEAFCGFCGCPTKLVLPDRFPDGRQNLGFPLKEQHLRLEVCQSKQFRHSRAFLPSLGPELNDVMNLATPFAGRVKPGKNHSDNAFSDGDQVTDFKSRFIRAAYQGLVRRRFLHSPIVTPIYTKRFDGSVGTFASCILSYTKNVRSWPAHQ